MLFSSSFFHSSPIAIRAARALTSASRAQSSSSTAWSRSRLFAAEHVSAICDTAVSFDMFVFAPHTQWRFSAEYSKPLCWGTIAPRQVTSFSHGLPVRRRLDRLHADHESVIVDTVCAHGSHVTTSQCRMHVTIASRRCALQCMSTGSREKPHVLGALPNSVSNGTRIRSSEQPRARSVPSKYKPLVKLSYSKNRYTRIPIYRI
jgi:hypothetical protein